MNASAVTRLVSAVLMMTALWSPARADEEMSKPSGAEARAHLSAGAQLYRVGEFAKAIDEYKQGALLEDAAVFHYNLGQCYRQLGQYKEAKFHYQRFLAKESQPDRYRLAAEGFVRDIDQQLQQEVVTRHTVENAAPVVDGTTVPTSAPDGGADVREPWYADGLGWGIAGTGALASGVAGWLLLDAAGLDDDANREPDQEIQADLRDRADSRRLAGAIVGVFGIAALATGIVKLAIVPKHEVATGISSLQLGLSPRGVVLGGTF